MRVQEENVNQTCNQVNMCKAMKSVFYYILTLFN